VKRTYQPSKIVRKRRHGFSRAHRNCRRTQVIAARPRPRPQAAIGLNEDRKPPLLCGRTDEMTTNAPSAPPRTAAPQRLRRRPEFLRAERERTVASSQRVQTTNGRSQDDAAGAPRFGVTVTKKGCGRVGATESGAAQGGAAHWRRSCRRSGLRLRDCRPTCGANDAVFRFDDAIGRWARALSRVSATLAPANPRNRPLAP